MTDFSAEIDGNGTVTLVIHKDKLKGLVENAWSDSATLSGQRFIEDILDNATPTGGSGRYVTCSGWNHIFSENGREKERETRWVYDRSAEKLVVLDIKRDNKWREASADEKADVLDSLVNGNPGCLDDPYNWEFEVSAQIPDWN